MESKSIKILTIDDNQDNLTILKALITEAFPKVVVFSAISGQKGLEIAAKEEPDIILLDIIMPGMDGYEVCRKLKANKKLRDIPVVFITAIKSNNESRIKALECGAEAFLTKPIDESELTAQIRAMFKIRIASIEKQNENERLAILVKEKTKELEKTNKKTLELLEVLRKENEARKEIQNALLKSEAKYRQIAENISDVVWTSDMDMRITYVSPSVEKVFGESPDAYMKKTMEEKTTPSSLKKIREIFSEELEKEKDQKADKNRTRIITFEHYRADGSVIWISMHVSLLRDKNGKVIGYQGVNRDITEQWKAEKALIESEKKYSNYIENAPDGVFVVDKNGRYIDVNKAATKISGYTSEELLEMSIRDITAKESLNTAEALFAKLLETGSISGELQYIHKNGSVRWWSLDAVKLNENRYLGFSSDITEQKKAREALSKSESRYKQLSEHSRTFIWEVDEQGTYTFVDHMCEAILGYPPEELIHKKRFYDLCPPEERQELKRAAFEVFRQKGIFHNIENKALTKRGLTVVFSSNGFPILKEDGSLLGYRGSDADITDRKCMENALKESEERHRLLITQMMQGLAVHEIILDESGNPVDYRFLDVNKSFEEMTNMKREDVIGRTVLELLPETESYWIEKYGHVALTGEPLLYENYSKELGKYYGVAAYSPKPMQFAVIINDITERKKAEDKLIYLNNHDHLTGLFNRRYLEEEIRRLDVKEKLPLSIIMADVNGLKIVNDSFGHAAGDELLKKAASTITKACRAEDIIVRYGGDEIVVVLPNTNNDETSRIASSIKELASQEKIANIELSISYGYATKYSMNESIMEILANAENYMYRHKLSERSSMRSETIEIIMNTLFEKSPRESFHSRRVSKICEAIAVKMEFEKQEVNQIKIAGLVHDIGKIGIDEKILNKPGRLNSDERIEIERHPEAGWRILSSSSEFAQLAQFVLHHHERWDGNGYPNKLIGENTPIEARIIAVADAYDAITSERSYKAAMSHEEAIKEILRYSGTQFDPAIVDVFVNIAISNSPHNL